MVLIYQFFCLVVGEEIGKSTVLLFMLLILLLLLLFLISLTLSMFSVAFYSMFLISALYILMLNSLTIIPDICHRKVLMKEVYQGTLLLFKQICHLVVWQLLELHFFQSLSVLKCRIRLVIAVEFQLKPLRYPSLYTEFAYAFEYIYEAVGAHNICRYSWGFIGRKATDTEKLWVYWCNILVCFKVWSHFAIVWST